MSAREPRAQVRAAAPEPSAPWPATAPAAGLAPPLAALAAHAAAAQPNAHAPYSRFCVGAAVAAGGSVYVGVNVENAAYPLTVCAERNAVAAAVAAGARAIDAVAVCTDASPPSSPCGGCRQVLLELAGPDPAALCVVAVNRLGEARAWTLAELLPHSFTGRELP
jgi:cytidine deaminase